MQQTRMQNPTMVGEDFSHSYSNKQLNRTYILHLSQIPRTTLLLYFHCNTYVVKNSRKEAISKKNSGLIDSHNTRKHKHFEYMIFSKKKNHQCMLVSIMSTTNNEIVLILLVTIHPKMNIPSILFASPFNILSPRIWIPMFSP